MAQRFVFSLVAAAIAVSASVSFAEGLKIGDTAPSFTATGVDGKECKLDELKDAKVVVVTFTCNRCPVAVAYEDRFIEFTEKYGEKGVEFVAINCNSREDLEAMKERAEEKGFNFTYAIDEEGTSGKGFGATVTPHIFVLDADRKVQYIGAFDDSMKKPTKNYVADAVDALLAGKTPEVQETRPVGCGISYKK